MSDYIVDKDYPVWDEIKEPLDSLLSNIHTYEIMTWLTPQNRLEHTVATLEILENELVERGYETS